MEKLWLKHYPPGVPEEIDADSYNSLNEMFENSVEKFKNLTAFSNFDVTLSYNEFAHHSQQFATFLQQQLKLRKGDRIALMMPNLLQYPICIFGALKAGLIVVNVNPLYTARELKFQLQDSGAKAIVVLSSFAPVVQKVLPETEVQHVIVTRIGDLLGNLKGAVVNFVVKYIKHKEPAWKISQAISFKEALLQGQKLQWQPVAVHGEDAAFFQYTGGTTGIPKGAVLTHRNLVANVLQCYVWMKSIVEGKELKVMGALPFYHIFALTACCLCFVMFGGECVLITNPRDIKGFIKTMIKHPPTIFAGINTLFNALLQHPQFSKVDFSRLRLTIAGGATTQKVVAKKWHERTGTPIIEGYGLTEASPVVSINPLHLQEYNGSVGLPVSSTTVKICNDDQQEIAINQPGELWVHGPQVMKEYWNNPEETRNVLNSERWLRTGDVARVDERGFLHIVDRKKDLILVSGFNVYPNEVEGVIASHPDVKEVAVIGVPHDKTGEAVKAFIVKKNPELTEEKVIAFCHQNLTAYKVPKLIEFVSELPKSNVGKVLRKELREKLTTN